MPIPYSTWKHTALPLIKNWTLFFSARVLYTGPGSVLEQRLYGIRKCMELAGEVPTIVQVVAGRFRVLPCTVRLSEVNFIFAVHF